jgi:hypothetical protein
MVYQDPVQALNPALRIGRPGRRVVPHPRPLDKKQAMPCAPRRPRAGQDRRSEARDGPLPAPALRRHAAARRHRHGPRRRPAAARARRTDDRPRRHRRGRGARPRARPAPRDQRRDPADRPQPRRDPVDVRPRRRHVRRQDRRAGRGPGRVRVAEAPVHDGSVERHPPKGPAQDRPGAVHDPGQPSPDRSRPADVCLRRPVPPRRRDLPDRGRRPWSRWTQRTGPAAITSTGSSRSARRLPTTNAFEVGTETCSNSTACRRPSASAATTSRRWSASTSGSPRARHSVSSASRAPASRRSPRPCSASTSPTKVA